MKPDEGLGLLVIDQGPIRRIIFNRPAVHNAQDPAMLGQLASVLDKTAFDRAVRVLVVAGTGKSFTSGHDLASIRTDATYAANAGTAEGRFRQEQRLFAGPVQAFRSLPIPTVAQVQGYCLAAGLMFVASADLVVSAEDAIYGSPVLATQGVNDAEVPSFMWRVGERRAKQALWMNERFDAREALAMGLVNWVVPGDELDAKVEAVCQKLLEIPREALTLSKLSFRFMSDRLGEHELAQYHFMAHQFSHQTDEARLLLGQRLEQK